MVDRVLVTARTAETISARITWADGSEPLAIEVPLMRYAHRRIAELVKEGLGNVEIARRLNALGLETSRGKPWSTATVWQARYHGVRSTERKRVPTRIDSQPKQEARGLGSANAPEPCGATGRAQQVRRSPTRRVGGSAAAAPEMPKRGRGADDPLVPADECPVAGPALES